MADKTLSGGGGGGGALLLAGALLIMFNPMADTMAKTMPGLSPNDDLTEQNNSQIICKSQDIRNTLDSFKTLEGCCVVEGFVQILLFDNVNETALNQLSFPNLREITDYLLIYRVNGLRSLENLFPNLSVIRGQDKAFGYSLVIYEMSSLQEIGLYSLTNITSGLIRIDKNPSLCYVNSIDWERIAHEKGEHSIKNSKSENECPLCPGDDGDIAEISCNQSDNKFSMGRHLCWNRRHCQKICAKNCIACDSKGQCCDEKCLGGCDVDEPRKCHVCRDFAMDGTCLDNCPLKRYEFLGRRCITSEECINSKRPLKLYSQLQHEHPFKIFQNKCILECPFDYTDNYVNHTCEPCNGTCTKECQGLVIDSVYSAKKLGGCTHINGSLEIQIRGGRKVVKELEENLSMIEEIDGYLKIVRSFPLVSLNFFKKLRLIRGTTLESQKYAFIVLDNQNLQDIWEWDKRTFRINNGRLFFHFNPRLCLDKIETLRKMAKLSNFTDLEVAKNSNGDKVACTIDGLNVTVTVKSSQSIVLSWQQFKVRDYRKLLGYVVYSIEAPYPNITLYDGRDACGDDFWRVDDVPILDENITIDYLLAKLNPYTQYAFYVKTYTIASETSGAQSQIYYVRTLPDQPTKPTKIDVKKMGNDTIFISWQKPTNPNGNVTYYFVTGEKRSETRDGLLKNRNYCNNYSNLYKDPTPKDDNMTPKKQNNTCDCDENSNTKIAKLKNATEAIDQISFEDKLYNYVYIKRPSTSVVDNNRRKREMEFPKEEYNQDIKNATVIQNKTDVNGKWTSFNFRVEGATYLKISNLMHYTEYEIKIQACRAPENSKDLHYCSETEPKTARTEKKDGADLITNITLEQNAGKVTVSWEEPIAPNGYILTYEIEYKNLYIADSTPFEVCISALDYLKNNKKYTLKNLNHGNYSLRIFAKSLAEAREWSHVVYFYIEEQNSHPTLLIGILVAVTCFMIIGIIIYILKRRYGLNDDMKLIALVNPEYVSTVYEPDDWEVLRDKIKLIKELGQGSFGMVYEGVARDIKGKALTRCAVKTVNEHATNRERIEFLNEASVMKAFDTAHVVRLLGVVSQGQPTLVVMELMANGDLKSYLRSHRPDIDLYDKGSSKQPPTLKRILQMAIEIADGMAYLSAKKFVHRDLAARNCMVAEDLTVKIGDFGMTRDIYETDYYRKGTKGLLPVRWMAPESLKDGVFTSSSDVWSYGVVLWEMATLASQPYQGLSNDQVLRYVIDGGIMEKPENCPDKLYNLMICCWRHKPSDRPSFLNLCSLLLEDACQSFSQISFYHSAAGMEARNSRPSQSPCQDDASTPLRRNQMDEDFSLTSSDDSEQEELEPESNLDFNSYPSMTKEVSSTANGYVSTRASNGTMT